MAGWVDARSLARSTPPAPRGGQPFRPARGRAKTGRLPLAGEVPPHGCAPAPAPGQAAAEAAAEEGGRGAGRELAPPSRESQQRRGPLESHRLAPRRGFGQCKAAPPPPQTPPATADLGPAAQERARSRGGDGTDTHTPRREAPARRERARGGGGRDSDLIASRRRGFFAGEESSAPPARLTASSLHMMYIRWLPSSFLPRRNKPVTIAEAGRGWRGIRRPSPVGLASWRDGLGIAGRRVSASRLERPKARQGAREPGQCPSRTAFLPAGVPRPLAKKAPPSPLLLGQPQS